MPNSEESCKRSHKATMQHPPVKTWTGHPYPAYKDSGVEWLGEVPQSWGIFRLKGVVANVTDLTKELDGDNIYLALEHVESWTGKFSIMNNNIDFDSQAKRFQSRDVLFGKLRPYLAKVVYPGRDGVCAGEFLVLRPRHAGLLSKYLEQLLRSKPVIFAIDASTFGAKMPRADWQFIGNMRIPLPPLSEQRAIAHFLDHANERIQRYIHAKEKLIKLLEEQKQVIIHQAVTGQIDVRTGQPYPAYKDSGVEWLGEVPEHWSVRRNGWLFGERNETGFGSLPILEVSLHKGVCIRDMRDVKRKQQITDRDQYKRARKGDIVYNTMRMWQGAVGVVPADGLVSPAYVVTKPTDKIEPSYYELLFRTDAYKHVVKMYSRGIVSDRDRLYWEDFKQIGSTVPPRAEQDHIVAWLHKKLSQSNEASAHLARQIELLHDYRTRLIADVVTGKLDVREAAAALPEKEPPTGGDNCQDGMAFAVQVQSRCP